MIITDDERLFYLPRAFLELEKKAAGMGISMRDVFKHSGIDKRTIERWRAGKMMPNYRSLVLLEEALYELGYRRRMMGVLAP